MQLEFKIRLQRTACVSVAASILEKLLTAQSSKEIFTSENKLDIIRDKWCYCIKEHIKKISLDSLPSILHHEIFSAILYMGIRIYEWFEHLDRSKLFGMTHRDVLFENYFKKIYWTHYGTVDEVKIFNLFWLNNPCVDICVMYNMACSYCLPEKIEYFWDKIIKTNQAERYKLNYQDLALNIFRNMSLNIVAYWNYVRGYEVTEMNFKYIILSSVGGTDVYDTNKSVEENMLRVCAWQGYHVGFKYFWGKLDEKKKRKNSFKCLKLMFDRVIDPDFSSDVEDKWCKISRLLFPYLRKPFTNFLLSDKQNFYTPKKRLYQLRYVIGLVNKFTNSWPWRDEHFFSVLKFSEPYLDLITFNLIYYRLLKWLEFEAEHHLPFENGELRRILKGFWQMTPSHYKLYVAKRKISLVFQLWELKFLKLILNDEALIEHRNLLLRKCHKNFFLLVQNGEVNKIEQFFCELLVPIKLKEGEQVVLKTIYKLILKRDIESANTFLIDCALDVVAKRNVIKSIEVNYVCYYFIKIDEFDLADEFLIWMLESTEKVSDFKYLLKMDEFSKFHIFEIWETFENNLELAVLESEKFLNWVTHFSEEEIFMFKIKNFKNVAGDFKKVKGDTEVLDLSRSSIRLNNHYLEFSNLLVLRLKELDLIYNFLGWCLWTKTEIEEFKPLLVSDYERLKS